MSKHSTGKRVLALAAVAAIFAFLFAYDFHTYLNYESISANQGRLSAWVASSPYISMGAFILVYIIVVAFSLPGAIWMTLTGGLLFGTWLGGGLTVIGATLGAALIFLAARYLIGDMIREATSAPDSKMGQALRNFETAFNRDATSYLLVLRLLPIFPFFIVNLGAALVGARFSLFFITTFFGIMPGTFVFASIGSGIASVLAAGQRPDLSIVTKPEIMAPLIGLAVLVLLPVFWRKLGRKLGRKI